MRLLAIDFGDKRTGLAICDGQETIVSPLAVLNTHGNLIDKIVEIINSQEAQGVVIGLPINMDGTEGPQVERINQFAEKLKRHTNLPIYFQDERLSSFDAEQKLIGSELTRKKKKKRLDAIAAASILRDFLDSRSER